MRRCEPGLFVARMDIDDRVFAASEMNLFFATTTFEVVQTPLSGAAPVSLGKAAGKVHAIAPAGAMKVFFTAENANGTTWDMWSAAVGTMGSATARGFQVGGTPVGLIAAGGNLFTQQVLPGGAESFNLTYCAQSGGGFSGIAGGTRPGRKLAAGSSYVFWTDQFGAVFAMPDAVGTRTTVAGAEGTADSPSWDGAMLYWVNNASGLLRRSAYPNNGASTFQDITFGANDLVVDATNVYYSQYDGIAKNFLYVIPKSAPLGTAPTVVATGEIRRLVQNPFAVFWVEPDGVHAYRKP